SLLVSLPILLLYVRSSSCARVILQLIISMIRCLQCGVSLILLVLHYHPALVTRVRLRRLLWRLGALMTFWVIFMMSLSSFELSYFPCALCFSDGGSCCCS